MGRRRKGKSVEVKLLIPELTYLQFEREICSGFAHKPQYGVRSQVITRLIQDWIASREAARQQQLKGENNGPDEPEPQRPDAEPRVLEPGG